MNYFIKQKLIGLGMILLCLLSIWLGDGDATFAVIGVPLGIYCIVSKKQLLMIKGWEDEESQ